MPVAEGKIFSFENEDSIKSDFLELTFINNPRYYQRLAEWVNNFIFSLHYPDNRVLGIGIAIQGLVSADAEPMP